MSNGLNKVLLIGNLAADSELKMTQGGTPVLKFRMGCTETFSGKDGQKKEYTEFPACSGASEGKVSTDTSTRGSRFS